MHTSDNITEAREALKSQLITRRRTMAAREHRVISVRRAIEECTCLGCGKTVEQFGDFNGYCYDCSATLHRMGTFKSKLNRGHLLTRNAVAYFIEDYNALKELPPAFHGVSTREDVVTAAQRLVAAMDEA